LLPFRVRVSAPAPTVEKAGEKLVRLGCGLLPSPLRLTDCGLPVALSAKLRLALRAPLTAGVKVTPTTQVPLDMTVAPEQVSLLMAKSLAFAPPIVTVEMVRCAVPLLVTVSVCAALGTPTSSLPKSRLAAEGVKAVTMPVPLSATVRGLPAALSVIFIDAMRLPVAEGVKVTLAVQLAPGATELPHVLARTKSAALEPVTIMLVIFKVALPLLVKVTL
jgi:hypothetical protein